jgi:hypothetical protein
VDNVLIVIGLTNGTRGKGVSVIIAVGHAADSVYSYQAIFFRFVTQLYVESGHDRSGSYDLHNSDFIERINKKRPKSHNINNSSNTDWLQENLRPTFAETNMLTHSPSQSPLALLRA